MAPSDAGVGPFYRKYDNMRGVFMKLFIVKHAWNTQGWIYQDRESAEKRLSSPLKTPIKDADDAELWDIIEVDAPTLKEPPPAISGKMLGFNFIKSKLK